MKLSTVVLMITLSMIDTAMCKHTTGLNGFDIRIAIFHAPPYNDYQRLPDGNLTHSGSSYETWIWLSMKLNFSITFVPVEDERLLAKYGVYDAAINTVLNQEADAIISSLIPTIDRIQKLDFTTFIQWNEPYSLIVPRPSYESRLLAFIRPFQPLVWLSLAIAIVGFMTVMSLFSWVYNKNMSEFSLNHRRGEHQISEDSRPKHGEISSTVSFYGTYVINILTNHGMYSPYSQNSFRILAGCWLLAALVLVNSYSSIIVSSLTVPVLKPAVNSFEDLVTSKEVFLVLRRDIVVGQIILNAKTGVLKTLGDQIRKYPDRLFLDDTRLIEKLQKGTYAYPFLRSFNQALLGKLYKKDGYCRFQLSDPLQLVSGSLFYYLTAKNFRYTQSISYGLMNLWETGLPKYWAKEIVQNAGTKCLNKNEKPKTSSAAGIKLEDLISAFLILGVGIGLALVSFMIELFYGHLTTTTRKQLLSICQQSL